MTQSPSLRERIKESTRPVHEKLDHDPLALRLMSKTAEKADYVAFLARTLGFLKPIEDLLHSPSVIGLAAPFWRPSIRRAPKVEQDLLAMGLTQAEINSLPMLQELPTITTAGHLMGVSYVIEGSAMGGLVMAKPVAKTLGLEKDSMAFFLPEEPRAIVERFEGFAAIFDSFAECECDERQASEAAHQTFSLIHRWFEQNA